MSTANFAPNQTTGSVFAATLKGKINGLEETVAVLQNELEYYKGEINGLKDEKCELEESLAKKTQEIRTQMVDEVASSNDNLQANFTSQKQENVRIQN